MTREMDFSSNYRRELLRAAKGDKRALIDRLRSRVPATGNDLAMIADLLTGKLQHKRPGGRPKLSGLTLRTSHAPMHRAVVALWDAGAYGTPNAVLIAERHGVDLDSLLRSYRRNRRHLGRQPGQKHTEETARSVRD